MTANSVIMTQNIFLFIAFNPLKSFVEMDFI